MSLEEKQPIVSIEDFTMKFGSKTVIDNLSFEINKGETFGLLGSNGSGKTTLLKCISGIFNSGKNIYINNIELINQKNLFRHISYIMSEDTLYGYLTVKENIKLYCELFGEDSSFIDQVYSYIKDMEILEYENYLVKHLSEGTKHKIYLSIMLSKKSNIIILDEPFSSIDKNSQEKMFKYIENLSKDKIIIYSTHIKEFEKMANKIINLEKVGE